MATCGASMPVVPPCVWAGSIRDFLTACDLGRLRQANRAFADCLPPYFPLSQRYVIIREADTHAMQESVTALWHRITAIEIHFVSWQDAWLPSLGRLPCLRYIRCTLGFGITCIPLLPDLLRKHSATLHEICCVIRGNKSADILTAITQLCVAHTLRVDMCSNHVSTMSFASALARKLPHTLTHAELDVSFKPIVALRHVLQCKWPRLRHLTVVARHMQLTTDHLLCTHPPVHPLSPATMLHLDLRNNCPDSLFDLILLVMVIEQPVVLHVGGTHTERVKTMAHQWPARHSSVDIIGYNDGDSPCCGMLLL